MMMKKTLIAAMGLAMVASTTVQADSLLFPFYRSGGGAMTFITIHTDDDDFDPLTGAGGLVNLHYIWNPNCVHEDAPGNMTAYDIIQQTVADPTISGVDVPASFGDQSNAAYSITPVPNKTDGFMIISNLTGGIDFLNPLDHAPEFSFRGEAVIVDLDINLVYSYKAVNNPLQTLPGLWSDTILTSPIAYDLTWYPTATVPTSWYILMTGDGMDNSLGWAGTGTLTNFYGNAYDRDENPRSGQNDNGVVCFETFTYENFLTAAQVAHTVNGGYVREIWSSLGGGASGGLMTKITTTNALGTPISTLHSESNFPNLPY